MATVQADQHLWLRGLGGCLETEFGRWRGGDELAEPRLRITANGSGFAASDVSQKRAQQHHAGGKNIRRAGRFRFAGLSANKDYTIIFIARRWTLRAGRVIDANSPANVLFGFWSTLFDVCYAEGWITSTAQPLSSMQWKLYSGDSSAASVARLFSNGNLLASGTATPANGLQGTLNIGGFDDASSEDADCEVAEVVMYNRKLSDAERQQVENYLRLKWNPIAPFKPTDYGANLLAWFDAADAASVQIAGSGVNNWVNKGVSAMTLTQPTDANRPSYASQAVTTINGQVLMAANSPAAFDAFWVGRPRPAAGNDWRTLFRNNTSGLHHLILENGSTRFGVYNAGFFPAGALTWDQVWGIGCIRYSASIIPTMSRDGGVMTSTTTTVPASGIGIDTVDAYSGPPPSQAWGDLSEIILLPYNSDGARQLIEGYLAWRWGLTALLPSDHPYKTTQP